MRARYLIRGAILAAAICAVASAPRAAAPNGSIPTGTATRYYKLDVHFRPFLLWMTREDVGGARLSWIDAAGPSQRLELLIGTDPERAPMGINRWGFITEQTDGDTTEVTGLMTETDDTSIDAARTNVSAMGARQVFRSIRGTVTNGEAVSRVSRIALPDDVTYRDYEALLGRLSVESTSGGAERLRLAGGTEPGFLTATRHLVQASTAEWQRARRAVAPLRRVYVYSGKPYELTLRNATFVQNAVVKGRGWGPAIEGQFEIRHTATGYTTIFTMLYGVAGENAGTPLRIVYRPRWWVELELLVVDPHASKNTFALRTGADR